jgi:TatD DNase family protein
LLLNVMKLVDVHTHIEDPRFEDDLDSVIERFKKAGGKFIINSGTNPGRNRQTLELAEKYDCVKCSFGMYPVGDYEDVDGELAWIEKHKDVCVAIGEIGLDFDNEERKANAEKQEKLFRKMLEFAKKLDKTVVIHSRQAELEAIEIMEELKMKNVVMHCFCGKKSLIKRGARNGWSFSVPPAIMRWENFKMLVEIVPLEQLLTETDAPYLGATAKERNEPANVAVTVKEISRIKGLDETEVAEQICKNARELFIFPK